MIWFQRLLGATLAVLISSPALAEDEPCGPEAPCEIDGGDYHLMFPKGWDGVTPMPALIFFHGFRSSGKSVFKSGSLKRDFGGAGYLVIAPNGAKRDGSDIRSWPARPDAKWRDDVGFTMDVLADAMTRAPIDRDRVYVSGFSAGGSMAWMIACYRGAAFAGFAPVAGALRRPISEDGCPGGSVRLLQVHGFSDGQVPFEGRGIRDWHQGDLFESFALARAANQCRSNPDDFEIGERFWCREWKSCAEGGLKMCLHPGGHGMPRGWSALARDWFEAPAGE